MKTRNLGIGIIVTLILAALKSAEVINWSWWIIFLPVIIAVATACIALIMFAVGRIFETRAKEEEKYD